MNSCAGCTEDSGFTLIELMFIVAILSILILIAVASFGYSSRAAARATCEYNRSAFETAAAMYRADNDANPTDIDDLAPYVANFKTANVCPGDGETALRYDTDAEAIACDYHQ
ncbi:MAG: type II secretion system protein [Coriobacteriia bacterium]